MTCIIRGPLANLPGVQSEVGSGSIGRSFTGEAEAEAGAEGAGEPDGVAAGDEAAGADEAVASGEASVSAPLQEVSVASAAAHAAAVSRRRVNMQAFSLVCGAERGRAGLRGRLSDRG
ncbi:hypothetical protein ADK74_26720 [Streptomyces decoyicus]|nr:hypothetical protein ADK74_26720 [Streptomyces decoyicus]